ncbi:MAG: protein kinase [Polyangiales bacterium]
MVADRSIVRSLPAICQFGRYELLGRIAVGGMAEIFLARERENIAGAGHRHLVIKRVLSHVVDDPTFQDMFFDEARLAMRLQHPAIVHIYEFGEEAGSTYLAMEWVDGIALGKLIRRARDVGGIPAPVCVKIAATVAEALHYAHRVRGDEGQPLGIVHRDVSPQNIMVSNEGNVKLLDFGIAKATDQLSRTSDGQVKGKFAYMAPEQCVGDPVDGRADVFALGVCLFESLTGKPLYHRKTQYETMRAVLEDPLPTLATRRPDLPEDLDAILQKALAKDAKDRFADAGQMQLALEQWLARHQEVVLATRIADHLGEVLGSDIVRGPQVDSTPFGQSFKGSMPAAPIPSLPPSSITSRPPPPASVEELGSSALIELESAEEKKKRPVWLWLVPLLLLLLVGGGGAAWLLVGNTEVAATPGAVTPGAAIPGAELPSAVVPGAETPGSSLVVPPAAQGEGTTGVTPGAEASDPSEGAVADTPPTAETPTPGTEAPAATDATGLLRVDSRPSGARVSIDGEFRGETPLTLDGLPVGQLRVEISRRGYRNWEGLAVLREGQTVALTPTLVRARPGARMRQASMDVASDTSAMDTSAMDTSAMEAAPPAMTQRAAGSGELRVNTRPWSRVYVGDRLLGTTPLGGVSLPAGRANLRFVDRDGETHRRSVTIRQGERETLFLDFSE